MELKQLTKDQLREAIRLSDLVFRDEEQISMGDAFTQIFHPPLESHSFGIYEDGRLVSFMGLVPNLIRIGDARITSFSLGSVATHPSYRGRGYASRLLTEVIPYAAEAGSSLLLVSGTLPLYRRAGCHPFGEVREYLLSFAHLPALSIPVPSYHIREKEPKDILGMAILAGKREVAFEQSLYDLMTLIEQESYASCLKMKHRTWIAEGKEGMAGYLITAIPYGYEDEDRSRKRELLSREGLQANVDMKRRISSHEKPQPIPEDTMPSFLEGKSQLVPEDKRQTLLKDKSQPVPERNPPVRKQLAIEWSGNPSVITALLAHTLREYPDLPLEIPVPFHEEEMVQHLSPFPSKKLENQGTIKVLNGPLLRQQLEPYLITLPAKKQALLYNLLQSEGEWDENKVKELFRHLPFPYTAGLNYI